MFLLARRPLFVTKLLTDRREVMKSFLIAIVMLCASVAFAADHKCPPCPHTQVRPPAYYPNYPHYMVPGNLYYDGYGRPYRGRPYIYTVPTPAPTPQWNPWPMHRQYPNGRGGYGKGPLYNYHYGPHGWGFGIGPNFTW